MMHSSTDNFSIYDIRSGSATKDPVEAARAILSDAVKQIGMLEACAYTIAALFVVVGYHMFSDGIFSCIVTLASVVQLLGLVLTLMKVIRQRSFGMISIKSLQMYVPVYVLRLSCTLFNEGYLPIDRSGDWAYQIADIVALGVVVALLVRSTNNPTVQEETFPIIPVFAFCAVLAMFIRPCHNLGTWSDVTWTTSVYLETFVMLPQLALVSKSNNVESLTSHSITCTAIYRGLNFWFWFICRKELVRSRCPSSVPSYFVVGALGLQFLILLDFVFYYAKAVCTRTEMTLGF